MAIWSYETDYFYLAPAVGVPRHRCQRAGRERPGWLTAGGAGGGLRQDAFVCLQHAGSDDGTLRVWDAAAGKLLKDWRGHANAVRQIVPLKGAAFVSAGEDGQVALWNAAGKVLIRFQPD